VFKILDADKTRVDFNSRWFGPMPASKLIEIASRHTVARMLERDDLRGATLSKRPIAVPRILYRWSRVMTPLPMQADVELGGTDQKFNLLVGRHLRNVRPGAASRDDDAAAGGTDGVNKMSKSSALHRHHRTRRLDVRQDHVHLRPDHVAVFELLSFRPLGDIAALRKATDEGRNPRDVNSSWRGRSWRAFTSRAADDAQRDFIARVTRRGFLPTSRPRSFPWRPRGSA